MHHSAPTTIQQRALLLPDAPVMALDGQHVICLTTDGEITRLNVQQARDIIANSTPIVCHAPHMAQRLNLPPFKAYDVLELFAFVHPGIFCAPTPRGLARALHLMEPLEAEDTCLSLRDITRHLLVDLSSPSRTEKSDPAAIAGMMGLMLDTAPGSTDGPDPVAGWPWAMTVLHALQREKNMPTPRDIRAAMRLWDKLPGWAQHAPAPPPAHHGVTAKEAEERLHKLLIRQSREDRPQQRAYAAAIAAAFAPINHEDQTHVVLAEAGTGVGKTLGYLSPATVWAEKNEAPVWVSTYTRNLQKQVDAELDKLYDDPVTKSMKVVTRKGRENYLCLLNLEDMTDMPGIRAQGRSAVALGLMLRWAAVTEDGDFAGKDFPGWLPGLIGPARAAHFADKRGECIYAACPHFDKCFVEKSVRKAKRADIVIANHALVMHQTVANLDETLPQRYIFDEGHHIFDAADSAFCAHLNGMETADFRRWLLGADGGRRKGRARGLKRRIEDLIPEDDAAKKDLDDILMAAQCLPGADWRQRLAENAPRGAAEKFLMLCRQQTVARNTDNSPYSIETPLDPPVPELPATAQELEKRLRSLQTPMLSLARRLQNMLEEDGENLDTATRDRVRFVAQSLTRRARNILGGWIDMLNALEKQREDNDPAVTWLEITRIDGTDIDAGMYRHYIDPAGVFAAQLKPFAHGVAVTSATLRDAVTAESDVTKNDSWAQTITRTGASVLNTDAQSTTMSTTPSPYNYAAQTRIIVIKDVQKNNTAEVADAMRGLFTAAGGGGLGIFTAIQRLKAVHGKILPKLEAANIPLYAQHVDALETSTLVDIFREEENACLLGTDATRDGIDVPGEALRLVIYDRVPWPRPTILHKARRTHFGRSYDDMLARAKLKQAYGRLIRTSTDKGVFVMLDNALPTRLCAAFPADVEVLRIGLKEAIETVETFLTAPLKPHPSSGEG
ncbi:MAG: ATP-dependent DNA helicase [Alphaproteobacteria bacterium]|nr:ATP-dependent DNA helicase [Alphaproteobacteria bacterium]